MRLAMLVALGAIASCADLSGLQGGATSGGPPDPDAGVPLPDGGAVCTILYVSPAGDDAADGCAPSAPLKTLTKAIGVAKTRGLLAGEIHACQGVYVETVRLDYPVSMVGSFDCGTWNRRDDLGPPSWMATTVIQPKDGTSTFTVVGAVERSTRVDGFRIDGPQSGEAGVALAIEGASPTIIRDRVAGGMTTTAGGEPASIAIYVRAGGSPEIRDTNAFGGAGTAGPASSGSMGLKIREAGDVLVAGCTINGGRGATAGPGFSTLGVFVKGGRPVLIQDSDIDGGQGVAQQGGGAGVLAQVDATLNLVHNTISAGMTTSAVPNAANVGVFYNGTGLIDRNRISGGVSPGSAATESRAVLINTVSKNVVVTNNAIHGGVARKGVAGPSSATGVFVAGSGATVRYNTIFAGETVGASATGISLVGSIDASIGENLIFGQAGGTGLFVAGCSGTPVKAVRGNAFFSLATLGLRNTAAAPAAPCDVFTVLSTVEQLESQLGSAHPTASIGDNVELRSSCATASCKVTPPCSTPGATCIGAVIAGWDELTSGAMAHNSNGFALAPGVSCAITKPSLLDPSTVTFDLAGLSRTEPKSLGANELDGTCTP